MTAELTIHFDTSEEFLRLIRLLKEGGIKNFNLNPRLLPTKKTKPDKAKWAFGVGNLGGRLDNTNIRDYANAD